MNTRKPIIALLIAWMALVSLPGCYETDNLPQLEVTVLDQDQAPLPDVYVALFASREDWQQLENPVQAWRQTGAEGKTLFIDLNEAPYWIYCRREDRDNSFDEIRTDGDLKMNQRARILIHLR
ncbi:MAG: hypothetical protein R6V75_05300 [Bacteroidales bacterium]